jgi:hypothetical protein
MITYEDKGMQIHTPISEITLFPELRNRVEIAIGDMASTDDYHVVDMSREEIQAIANFLIQYLEDTRERYKIRKNGPLKYEVWDQENNTRKAIFWQKELAKKFQKVMEDDK